MNSLDRWATYLFHKPNIAHSSNSQNKMLRNTTWGLCSNESLTIRVNLRGPTCQRYVGERATLVLTSCVAAWL